jgi:hypothetical protein
VIKGENVGAGCSVKGFPDENSSTEIGYGIEKAYQKGYI